jgi:hypothetical protein
MAQMNTTRVAGNSAVGSQRQSGLTRALLGCGIAAGPLYILVGSIEALTRPGFDPTRDDLSLLSNGALGWIHVALLVTTGLLTMAGAWGMRRSLDGGRAATWGPLLIGLYGLGLVGAGIFSADPTRGFPPGTSAGAHAVSWHGLMHFVSGGIGFIGLIAACLVFARRFARLKQRAWATYSVITGVLFFAAFFGIASGSQQGGTILVFVTLAFTAAVILGWAWVSALSVRLLTESAA